MTAERCESCRFQRIDLAGVVPVMTCHRWPPQAQLTAGDPIITHGHDFNDDADEMAVTADLLADIQRWPEVGPDDWCGEYRAMDSNRVEVRIQGEAWTDG